MTDFQKAVLSNILISIIFVGLFNISSAMGVKTVEGYIYDKDFNPLAGVRVLLSVDGRFITGVATDQSGWFILEFNSGKNDLCSLNILSKSHAGIFSDVEISEDTTYIEFNLEDKPRDMVLNLDLHSMSSISIPEALTKSVPLVT